MISQEEIGKRITYLRKKAGFSQEQLAQNMGIPRTTLAQMELGNRKITIQELMDLAAYLHVDLNVIISKDFRYGDEGKEESQGVRKAPKKKAWVFDEQKFKNVLLYILEKCAGKPNVGETVLYKLLYFADFNYYEKYKEYLTGVTYRKLPFGPVPSDLLTVIEGMTRNSELQMFISEYHGYHQKRYIPLINADLRVLKASEKEIIDNVITQLSNFNGSEISNYSHNDVPWLETEDNEIIDYNLVFKRRAPYKISNEEDKKNFNNE